jgi:hypothetical protein
MVTEHGHAELEGALTSPELTSLQLHKREPFTVAVVLADTIGCVLANKFAPAMQKLFFGLRALTPSTDPAATPACVLTLVHLLAPSLCAGIPPVCMPCAPLPTSPAPLPAAEQRNHKPRTGLELTSGPETKNTSGLEAEEEEEEADAVERMTLLRAKSALEAFHAWGWLGAELRWHRQTEEVRTGVTSLHIT